MIDKYKLFMMDVWDFWSAHVILLALGCSIYIVPTGCTLAIAFLIEHLGLFGIGLSVALIIFGPTAVMKFWRRNGR